MPLTIDEAFAVNERGQALEKKGQVEEAIALYERGVAAGTDTPFTYRRLVTLYRKSKRRDDERRICELAAALWPTTRDGLGNTSPSEFTQRLAKLKSR